MQVDWTNAPDWANYHAIDSDSQGNYYELEPSIFRGAWNNRKSRYKPSGFYFYIKKWKETLTKRPKEMYSDKITIDFDQKLHNAELRIKELENELKSVEINTLYRVIQMLGGKQWQN